LNARQGRPRQGLTAAATATGWPASTSETKAKLAKSTEVPTDRSMPPEETANVMATATIASSVKLLTRMLCKLATLRNVGAAAENMAKTATSASNSRSARGWQGGGSEGGRSRVSRSLMTWLSLPAGEAVWCGHDDKDEGALDAAYQRAGDVEKLEAFDQDQAQPAAPTAMCRDRGHQSTRKYRAEQGLTTTAAASRLTLSCCR